MMNELKEIATLMVKLTILVIISMPLVALVAMMMAR